MKRKLFSLENKKTIFLVFLVISNFYNCIPWPSALLGSLVIQKDKKSPLLFSPLGISALSGMGNSSTPTTFPEDSPNVITPENADFFVSQRTGLLTSELGTNATFTVKLTRKPSSSVSLHLVSSNLSEITVSPSNLIFTEEDWQIEQTVTLTGVNDYYLDGNRAVTIDLGSAISLDTGYNQLSAGVVEAENIDDETKGITVSLTSGHIISEQGSSSSFHVVLNSKPTADVVIPVVSNDLTEGLVSPPVLVFTEYNWNLPQTVIITGVDDNIADGNTIFTIALNPSTSDDPNFNELSQSNIGVTNQDNDLAGFTIINPTLTTSESGIAKVFYVVLNSEPTDTVYLPLLNQNPTEGSINKIGLTFSTSSWNIEQAVTVTGLDDFNLDGNINYFIQVGAPESNDTSYSTLSSQSVTVTNLDNDTPGFNISSMNRHTNEDLESASFQVKLYTIPSNNVSISFSSSDTSEGIIQSGASLVFTQANWNSPQTVIVKGVNDNLKDGDITFSIISSPATSEDTNYNGINPVDISVINDDNDTAGVVVAASPDPLVTTESGGKAAFTLKLRTKPTANVTISGIVSSNTSAGSVSPTSVTFTPTNWSIPKVITITGVDNAYYNQEGILYSIHVPSPTSVDLDYVGLPANSVNVKNSDNDTRGYTISKTKNFITADSNKSDSFTIRLNTRPVGGDVVIPVTSANNAEVIVSPSLLTFTANNWNTPQTVTMIGKPDGVVDGSKQVTIALGTPTSASSFKDYYPNATGSDYTTVKLPDYNGATANNGMFTLNNCDTDTKIAVCLPIVTERITSEAGTSFQYYILLNQPPVDTITFNVSSSNINEGTVSVASITRDATNWDSIQLITVTGVNDPTLEVIGEQIDGEKIYSIIHSTVNTSDSYYNGFDVADIANIRNTDPDKPAAIFTPVNTSSNRILLINNESRQISVRLNAQPIADVSFNLSGLGFTSNPASLIFTSTNWNVNQQITVSYNGTSGNKTLLTSAFSSADMKFQGKTVEDVFFNIVQAGFTIGSISGNTDETGTTRTFTVKLNSPPAANVVVSIASTNTNEVIVQSNSTLTFTSANWNTTQTVTVKGVDDLEVDGDKSVRIELLPAVSTDISYNGLDPVDVIVINLDND